MVLVSLCFRLVIGRRQRSADPYPLKPRLSKHRLIDGSMNEKFGIVEQFP